ncbi:hypothetical protein [Archangium sp.]|jgi:hypothetical protein|uniref:hypothetical protein n=1 Tax=Archangium sp. TaxID=1872627 RepID=UPI002ED918F2
MSYSIHLPEHLLTLMESLPWRTCASIHLMLERVAELAALWPPADWRWKQFAYQDDQGMRFYVHGCCVRFCLEPEARCVVVRDFGRVLVRLPSERLDSETGSEASPAQQ